MLNYLIQFLKRNLKEGKINPYRGPMINPYRGPIKGKPVIGKNKDVKIDGMLFQNGMRIDGIEVPPMVHKMPGLPL